jgi:hypothetical protein
MIRLITTATFLFCITCAHAQFFDSLSMPSVWLRADRSVLTTSKWTDVSGNGRDATALGGENPIQGSTLNFNKALLFDGVNDYLKIPVNLDGLSEITVLSVFHSSDTAERGTWGAENALSRDVMLTTRRATGPDTVTDNYGKNENQTVLNTIAQSWESTTTKSATAFLALGSTGKSRGHKPFKGSVAEMLVFNRALGFLERLQVETYLALKYGASMPGRNYISSDEKVVWKADDNAAYSHRIAGIGRDDAFLLYQKQAHSAYDSGFLTISVNRLSASNDENTATVNHGDFLLWGDNNATRVTKPGEGKDSVLAIVQRQWLLTATGTTANQLATEVAVDLSQLPTTTLGYWLVIDRSGQGNFSIDNLEYISADRTTNGKAVYKIQWDTDRSGKDSFGFARARNLFAVVRKLNDPSCTNETAGRVRIEMIAGNAPYTYALTGKDNTIDREGKIADKAVEQKDLLKGEYTFVLKDDDSDVLTRNFNLAMPDALDIRLGEDQRLASGSEIVLDVKPHVPDSIPVRYQWENNFGFTSTASKVTITESGIYRVTVTKEKDGCAFSDEVVISGSDEQKLAVYPTVISNGDTYNISISLPEPGSVGVQVFDLKGTPYPTMSGENNSEYHFKATLNNSGMYMVVIQTPNGTESRKVIVQ